MRRLLIVLFIVLAVVLVGVAVTAPALGAQANDGTGRETATVQRADVDVVVSTTGTVAAERLASMGFGTSGTVDEILVSVGQSVAEGEALARLNTEVLTLQVENAEQALAIAQANYNRLTSPPTEAQRLQAETAVLNAEAQLTAAQNARRNAPDQQMVTCMAVSTARTSLDDAQTAYDRYISEGLNADPVFTADPNHPATLARDAAQRAFDQAEAQCRIAETNAQDTGQLAAAESAYQQAVANLTALTEGATENDINISAAQVRQAEIALEQARRNLNNATLTAPFEGVVSEVNLRLGQTVSPGAAVIILADLVPLHVDSEVDELDVSRLLVGMEAEFLIDALDIAPLPGTVSQIAPVGRVVQGVTTYGIRVDFEGETPEALRAGMGGEVDIVVGTVAGALLVPTRAIQRDDATEYVLVVQEGSDAEPVAVPVTSGQSVGELTVITPLEEGTLDEGDVVVVGRPRANIFQPGGTGTR